MQITIDTQAEPLLPIIRMLQALHEAQTRKLRVTHETTGETIAELAASSIKVTNGPIEDDGLHCTGHVDYAPETRKAAAQAVDSEGENLGTASDHTADANSYGLHYTGHDYAPETPTPEQVFAAPKSLFDASDDPVQPPSHSDVTVDKSGLPWDARIHSGAKTKLANGNWKLLRGVDPALVASVEAELRGDPKPASTATETAGPTITTVAATHAAAPIAPPAASASTPTMPPPPPAPPAPPVASAAPKPITNAAELVAAVMDKRFTTDQVNAACRAVGVDNVASLLAKQDKLPEVLKELGV